MRSIFRLTFSPVDCLCLCLLLVAILAPTRAVHAETASGLQLDQAGGMAGIGIYDIEQWGLVRSVVSNHSQQTMSPLVAHTLGDDRQVEFAHRVWLPPQTRRTLFTPVYPLSPSRQERALELHTRLIDDSGRTERAAPPTEGLLLAARGTFHTGIMVDRHDDAVALAAGAMRLAADLSTTAAYINDRSAPPLPDAWGTLDVVVLGRTPDFSPAQTRAMRDWVLRGGRLWVMLDKVDPHFLQQLFGDAWNVAVLDRVQLETLTIDSERPDADPTHLERDYGFEMVRTAAPGMTVTHRVDSYPAAMWQPMGQGMVLATTLHAAAWMNDEGEAAAPLRELAWFSQKDREREQTRSDAQRETLAVHALEQTGHTVMARQGVLIVLALFAVALLGGGLLLLRADRLELIAPVGVVLAAAAAFALVGMGQLRHRGQPTAIASAHLLTPADNQSAMVNDGVVSIFRPSGAPSQATLAGDATAIAWPEDAARSTERLRMVWHSPGRWELSQITLPGDSVRQFRFDHVQAIDQPVAAHAYLTEEGLAGEVRGAGRLSDAVLATRDARFLARFNADGGFVVSPGDRLAGGQFVQASVTLTQRQMSRQTAYRNLLAEPGFIGGPTLLAWADDADLPLSFSNEAVRRQGALLALPIVLQRPEPGERVTVPAPLLTMEPFHTHRPTTFDQQRREWVPSVSEQPFLVQFELPEAVHGLEVESAVLDMELDASGWRYQVVRYRDGEVETVHEGTNPHGRVRVELSGAQRPVVHDNAVVVGLHMTPLPGSDTPPPWVPGHLELSVRGVAR
ncbi:MAG: hypothetical protein WD118_11070 [Phycisphaeraceae bacterium]